MTSYGPTAARKHNRPGRETRPRTTTIDIHSHVSVPAAAAIVEPFLDVSTIPLTFFSTPETKVINAQQDADRRSRMSGCGDGLTDRLRDLDEMGIDLQVVMPPPQQCYYTVPIDISVKATQIVNDGIAEYVARKPDRFVALGSVPMTDSREAVTELERGMRHLGLKGAQVLTNVADLLSWRSQNNLESQPPDATRSHPDHRGLRCGMSSSQYRYQLRRSHSVLLLRTLRAPCLGAPGQLIAGVAGARPDHSISVPRSRDVSLDPRVVCWFYDLSS